MIPFATILWKTFSIVLACSSHSLLAKKRFETGAVSYSKSEQGASHIPGKVERSRLLPCMTMGMRRSE